MVDQSAASLSATMTVLIAAIQNLTVAINDNIHTCDAQARKHSPTPEEPIDELSSLSLGPSQLQNDGESPAAIRQALLSRPGPTQGSWYIVTVGYEPGVYQDSAQVASVTSGVSGNSYKKYASQEAALQAYERAWAAGVVKRVR